MICALHKIIPAFVLHALSLSSATVSCAPEKSAPPVEAPSCEPSFDRAAVYAVALCLDPAVALNRTYDEHAQVLRELQLAPDISETPYVVFYPLQYPRLPALAHEENVGLQKLLEALK